MSQLGGLNRDRAQQCGSNAWRSLPHLLSPPLPLSSSPFLSLLPDPGLGSASVLHGLARPPLVVLGARKADALRIKGQYLPCSKEAQRQLEEEQVTYFAGWLKKKKKKKKPRNPEP